MLSYIGTGERRYGEHPVAALRRNRWEFQAVLSGRIGLLLPEGPDILRAARLWVASPESTHGWVGERGRPSEIAVFHFPYVPEPLARLIPRAGRLDVPLSPGQCRRLRELGRQARRFEANPSGGMMICHEHILFELSLLAYERAAPAVGGGPAGSKDAVTAALRWFEEHMAENPGLEKISRIAGVSPAHLRRLFHETFHVSPKQVLDQIRFRRATKMMADSDVKLASVAEACGFGSPSAFSRAFRAKFDCSPESWRS